MEEEADSKILILNLSGKLTREDYANFIPEVERTVKAHSKVRMHGFHDRTIGAAWEDIKFELHHFADIERLALIGENRWEAGMAVFCKPFTTAKLRDFDESKADVTTVCIYVITL
ncbi:SpoIIAA family protein [Singulisphaera acidiphila]|uniref:STAS/SEC14 domain-containing protein n=1 Tax=Singulisphaera acidiphila (strain ATCC BAA-1392 / DSM 18658 / VKM B-2454 / MOB10) TaxID=886293 RepID=L0DAS6_SINAD|nr:STAS/SEC14 domain-containing protein [Singulisphaera acidiphila]AGA26352.1 Protein of unknown function (DUF3478) [Singulisphaera acidiphila DSM 18658]